MPTPPVILEGLSNAEFLDRFAAPGRVGLVAGASLADRAIARAQLQAGATAEGPVWTHAFLCQGRRLDGHHWVIESDLEVHRRHIRLGVQENRLSKFHDAGDYPALALVDFTIEEPARQRLLAEALNLVADRTCYSIRELFGTLLALHRQELRPRANLLARDRSIFCSAFVRHCFEAAGVDLLPGVDIKNTTPADLARSPVESSQWRLARPLPESRLAQSLARVKRAAGQLARRNQKGASDGLGLAAEAS